MSTKTTVMKTESGFTLVELMVVVAIIGILAAIAIPNFRKYQAKSRTSEAKLMLAAAYTSEEAYYQEYNHYSTCLSFMGFLPTGFTTTSTISDVNYYSVGFNAVLTRPTGVNTNNIPAGCDVARAFYYLGRRAPAGVQSNVTNPLAATSVLNAVGTAYIIESNGIIDQDFATSTTDDSWTINQTKALIHVRNGY